MTCDDIRPLLADLAVGALPEHRQRPVREHLAECAPCRGALEQLRLVGTWLDETPPAGPSRDLWPSISAALQPRRRSLGQRVSGYLGLSPGWAWGGVACACAILVLAVLSSRDTRLSAEPAAPLVAEADEDADLFSRWSAQASLSAGPVGRYAAAAALSVLPELGGEEGLE